MRTLGVKWFYDISFDYVYGHKPLFFIADNSILALYYPGRSTHREYFVV